MAESFRSRKISYSIVRDELGSEVDVDGISDKIRGSKDCYLIGVAGIPGSGKTELAKMLTIALDNSVTLSMDGYHIERKNLSEEDMKVRGAPHTFYSARFRDDIRALKQKRQGRFPSFDHSVKDPVEEDIVISLEYKYVIVEGLYLFFEDWEVRDLFDFQVYLDCPLDVAMERVAHRHLSAGIEPNIEAARQRADQNDRKNAQTVLDKSVVSPTTLHIRTG